MVKQVRKAERVGTQLGHSKPFVSSIVVFYASLVIARIGLRL